VEITDIIKEIMKHRNSGHLTIISEKLPRRTFCIYKFLLIDYYLRKKRNLKLLENNVKFFLMNILPHSMNGYYTLPLDISKKPTFDHLYSTRITRMVEQMGLNTIDKMISESLRNAQHQ